jgi:hypothetical protein
LKKLCLGQCVIELLQYYVSRRTMMVESIRWRRWPPGGKGIEKFTLGQCIIELLQYYISRRTMPVEIIRWRMWPPGDIWVEKVLT